LFKLIYGLLIKFFEFGGVQYYNIELTATEIENLIKAENNYLDRKYYFIDQTAKRGNNINCEMPYWNWP
jgi:hypothetical protein